VPKALLYDSLGREVYEGGLTHEDVRDAIQAAALANDFQLAHDIAERHGWRNCCLSCASPALSTANYVNAQGSWRVCTACDDKLRPRFSDAKMMLNGLIKRDVA